MENRELCYDPLPGRYFYADINEMKKYINELNDRIRSEAAPMTLDEFFKINRKRFKRNEKGFKHRTHRKKRV